ncbi:relaxin-3-like [Mauremys mutica]|uniref:relaxin-3-like n=1 Tax=Mauremys mutica TaxID=74926 RepID=UPI001D167B8C|nr:relaxin-3-like [Mauremys mutica]
MQKLLLALAFGTLLSELRLGAEGRNPPYGVKLCGREFIRAVIFTCGGSRWRRAGDLDILSGPPAGEDSSETASSEWDASRLPGMLPHQDLSPDYHERWRGSLRWAHAEVVSGGQRSGWGGSCVAESQGSVPSASQSSSAMKLLSVDLI